MPRRPASQTPPHHKEAPGTPLLPLRNGCYPEPSVRSPDRLPKSSWYPPAASKPPLPPSPGQDFPASSLTKAGKAWRTAEPAASDAAPLLDKGRRRSFFLRLRIGGFRAAAFFLCLLLPCFLLLLPCCRIRPALPSRIRRAGRPAAGQEQHHHPAPCKTPSDSVFPHCTPSPLRCIFVSLLPQHSFVNPIDLFPFMCYDTCRHLLQIALRKRTVSSQKEGETIWNNTTTEKTRRSNTIPLCATSFFHWGCCCWQSPMYGMRSLICR